MTISESLAVAIPILRAALIDSAQLDAELIIAHVLNKDRVFVLAHPDQELDASQVRAIKQLIAKRADRVPLAYLTGTKEFYGLSFHVNKYTLIPRPETEQLVSEVLEYVKQAQPRSNICPEEHPHIRSIIELGVGSGCVILSILKNAPQLTTAFAIDRVKRAIEVAKQNAEALGLSDRISFKRSDMWKQVPREYQYDIVVANVPYLSALECAQAREAYPEIAYEPQIALLGGTDGLLFFTSLFQSARRHLRPHARLFLEIGTHQQDAIKKLAHKHLPEAEVTFKTDDCNNPRVAIIALP